MSDNEPSPTEPTRPPTTSDPSTLSFFLGGLSEQVRNTAREVANLLGPRMSGMERRIERLENWRNWLTGVVAALIFIAAVAEGLRWFYHG